MKINHLKLQCSSLEQQKHFYTRKFRFKILEETEEYFTLEIGNSKLTFEENRMHNAYYHFAFNIPHDLLDDALKWVGNKVDMLKGDDGYVHNFDSWKARAIYFLDPNQNVVEMIGRKRLPSEFKAPFNERKVMSISEVGFPVSGVNTAFELLEKETGIEKFDCESSIFCACGDEEGLFILVDRTEKEWFPTEQTSKAFPMELDCEIKGQSYHLTYDCRDIELSKKKLALAKLPQ